MRENVFRERGRALSTKGLRKVPSQAQAAAIGARAGRAILAAMNIMAHLQAIRSGGSDVVFFHFFFSFGGYPFFFSPTIFARNSVFFPCATLIFFGGGSLFGFFVCYASVFRRVTADRTSNGRGPVRTTTPPPPAGALGRRCGSTTAAPIGSAPPPLSPPPPPFVYAVRSTELSCGTRVESRQRAIRAFFETPAAADGARLPRVGAAPLTRPRAAIRGSRRSGAPECFEK